MDDYISKSSVCEILADIYPTDGEKVVEVKEINKAYEEIIHLPSAQPDLQPPCNNLATDAVSRKAAIEALDNIKIPRNASWYLYYHQALTAVSKLPSVQTEINCSEIPNTSDFVSRKAVREMVATWSYDMAEWEDMELALHDVDELPPVSAERQRGKENE